MNRTMQNYYTCARPEIQEMVSASSQRILDVGCAAGSLGAALKTRQQAELWGVEFVAGAAELAAQKLDRVIPGTIEDSLTLLPDGYFDTIICSDVLEHLVNPWQVLAALKTKLASGGELIASIPNIRHWSVIRGLLEGHWQYRDAGILDRTHLRFFTRNDILDLFSSANFELIEMYATSLSTASAPSKPLVEAMSAAGLNVASLEEESQHYQYLIKALPKPATG